MSKDKGDAKIREALKREALNQVPPGKPDPKPLTKILRIAKDNDDSSDSR